MHNRSFLKNLKLLWWLRNIAIIGQSAAIFIVIRLLDIPLMEAPLWALIASLVVLNIITIIRIKYASDIKECEFFCQLLLDIIILYGLLYFTGGATNPFAQLFILQVIIAAITLSPIFSWSIAVIAIAAYTSLMLWNVEVPYFLHHHMGDFFSLHVQGMWINFILLSCIVAWFVVRMNVTIKRQDLLLAKADKIAAISRLATSAAHELEVPLAKLSELAKDFNMNISKVERDKKAEIFSRQFGNIENILGSIAKAGKTLRDDQEQSITPLETVLKENVESFRKLSLSEDEEPGKLTLFDAEREYIFSALRRNNNNISATARELGMHRRTLQRKLDKLR